jgi:hypothetical protein
MDTSMTGQTDTRDPHRARPSSEELVPSRYAVRIGEIDVLVVSDGVLPLPTAMLAHNADPALRAEWLDDMFLAPDAFDWPLNAVLVQRGEQVSLRAVGGVGPYVARRVGRVEDAGQLRPVVGRCAASAAAITRGGSS